MAICGLPPRGFWAGRAIRSTPTFSAEKKKHILERLTAAEGLERYLHTKYVGAKRFSLEGGESFIASMDEVIQRAGEKGVQEIVIGMAHRGRLNVLVNTLGKAPSELFEEFEGKHADDLPAGDVKYHQGFSSDVSTRGGPVHALLLRAQPRLVGPDLADDPRPDAGVADAVGRLADELVGQVVHRAAVDPRVRRVVGGPIPAAAHHDVQVAPFAERPQPPRVAADPVERQVDEGAADLVLDLHPLTAVVTWPDGAVTRSRLTEHRSSKPRR